MKRLAAALVVVTFSIAIPVALYLEGGWAEVLFLGSAVVGGVVLSWALLVLMEHVE